jgi:hypothetical protein
MNRLNGLGPFKTNPTRPDNGEMAVASGFIAERDDDRQAELQ